MGHGSGHGFSSGKDIRKYWIKENGKVAREYFDNISLLASSDMYVSWVKAAGRFSSKNKSNISYASKYNVPEVLGATYLDVIGMAEKDPSKYGYFFF